MLYNFVFNPAPYTVGGDDRFVTWKDRYNALANELGEFVYKYNELSFKFDELVNKVTILEQSFREKPKDDGSWIESTIYPLDIGAADVYGTDDGLWTDLMLASPPDIDAMV